MDRFIVWLFFTTPGPETAVMGETLPHHLVDASPFRHLRGTIISFCEEVSFPASLETKKKRNAIPKWGKNKTET